MGFSRRLKGLVRRLAVTLFGLFELLGLPRVPEKSEGDRGQA